MSDIKARDLVRQFRESLDKLTEEEYGAIWEELKHWNEVGPVLNDSGTAFIFKDDIHRYMPITTPSFNKRMEYNPTIVEKCWNYKVESVSYFNEINFALGI